MFNFTDHSFTKAVSRLRKMMSFMLLMLNWQNLAVIRRWGKHVSEMT